MPASNTRRVSFYRTLTNDTGHCVNSVLETIDIRSARTSARALTAAKRRFEHRRRLRAWDDLAHGYVIEEGGGMDAGSRAGPGGDADGQGQ